MSDNDLGIRSRRRAIDVTGEHAGTISVSRSAYGSEHNTNETVRVPVFHTTPAKVRVEGGITRNMGDYNSVRVSIVIEMPCLPEITEIERCYQITSDMVDEMINRELSIATGTAEEPVSG
jgi:hypothetical protein